MANCVLCGQKVGMFDQVKIDFHNTKQTVCGACSIRLDAAAPQERALLLDQILDSPHLEDGERIRADLDTGRPCPACGTMLERKLQNFSIGADGGGGLITLLADTYDVDLYACPRCGKVELYTAGFHPEGESPPEPEDGTVVCPVCGTRHSGLIGCPSCALNGARGPSVPPAPPRKKEKTRKPPWER